MHFGFFEQLSPADADAFLQAFLEAEAAPTHDMLMAASADGLPTTFTPASISPVLLWVLPRLVTVPRPPDPAVPAWIRATPSYSPGLFDFAPESAAVLLRCAYFLGMSFVRTYGCLRWSVGDQRFAQKHMPVIVGFKHSLELPVLLVVENLFRRLIADHAPETTVSRAIDRWIAFVPA